MKSQLRACWRGRIPFLKSQCSVDGPTRVEQFGTKTNWSGGTGCALVPRREFVSHGEQLTAAPESHLDLLFVTRLGMRS